ncbi:hypothetical protein EXS56_02845 [Candidatus Kaiserbacteria bacterium]|nr:hypothetical protein [Candidatus Kaiserbacteria bacterium]
MKTIARVFSVPLAFAIVALASIALFVSIQHVRADAEFTATQTTANQATSTISSITFAGGAQVAAVATALPN